MMLVGVCKKCGETVRLDIGDMSRSAAIEMLQSRETFSCPGHHVELSSPVPNYWDVATWELVEGAAPGEDEFLEELRRRHREVRDTDGMAGLITGFACGYPLTNDGKSWNFVCSPRGRRWYYTDN